MAMSVCRVAAVHCCRGLLLLLAAGSALAAPAVNVCTPEVIGAWKLENSVLTDTTLLQLGRDGWVNVLSGPSEQPAASYEIVAQVRYAFTPTRNPKRIEFITRSGNDIFTAGKSHWDITAFNDQSLTTHASAAAAGEQMLWSRVVTQRYFLTLAARSGTAAKPAAAFVMWTTLGGKTELEALGARGDGASARLGRIPLELAREFTRHSGRAEDVMLRIELSEAEYHRTHRVLESWDVVLKNDRLARNDPVAQLIELLDATLQSVNRCVGRLQVRSKPVADATASAVPLQWIRELRRLNDKRHVSDRMFPFGWKPPAVG
jgi:hypothetical protein